MNIFFCMLVLTKNVMWQQTLVGSPCESMQVFTNWVSNLFDDPVYTKPGLLYTHSTQCPEYSANQVIAHLILTGWNL